MNNMRLSNLVCLFIFLSLFSCTKPGGSPYDLNTEYMKRPLGIDTHQPRFTWKFPSNYTGTITSTAVWLASDSIEVLKQTPESWSKIMHGEPPIRVTYDGAPLQSYTTYYWRVGYQTDKSPKYNFSHLSSFTTGVMSPEDWVGEWIYDGKGTDYLPSPYFRKSFEPRKGVERALITIASAGLYELSVNGERVGDHFLDPMYTRFDKRILSVTYDITSQLEKGENVLGVQLGNGWYNHQSTAVWDFDKAFWRNRPSFSAQLRLDYKDGTQEYIITDDSWKHTDSPLIFNSIYTAEHYDARKEIPGWNKPGYKAGHDEIDWKSAIVIDSPTELIKSQVLAPVREIKRYTAEEVVKINDTCFVYHFPQNIAGIVELKMKGEEGQVVRLKHGEMLYPDGTVNTENIDYHYRPTDDSDPFQIDIVILSGKNDLFSPKFNYKGFQYVEVTSPLPLNLSVDNLVAIEMHSDVPQIGYFQSSSELLNKIWAASNSSYLANLFGYPTDCPQREKNGWTGDAHINIQTALYNFDAITIYEKWMNDFLDQQKDNGVFPSIVPTADWGWDWGNGVDWTSAAVIIPWEIYLFYGDNTLLKRMYPAMKKYVSYIESRSENYLTDWGLGDWIPVQATSDLTLTTSAYYFADVTILSKAARLLEQEDDADYYEKLADNIKNSFNRRYLNTATGIYASGTQTELSMPLYWGLVPEEHKARVAENLNNRVAQDNYHLNVGLLGSKSLLGALSDNGYMDTAYKLATNETYPSWGYWIANGATTFRENWRMDVIHDNSFNHIMFGEIGGWLYKGLGGIRLDENNPGFRHLFLSPQFPEGLDSLDIDYYSPYGWLMISWKRITGNKISYSLTIPQGTAVTYYSPAEATSEEARFYFEGTHTFEIALR